MRKSGLPRLSGKDGKEAVPKRSLLPPPRAGRPPSQGVANVVSPTDQPDVTEFGSKSQLTVGDRVTICGVKLGVVRYIGSTHFGEGEWCGIELDEAEGKHDGETEGMRYFTCSPNHGIFAPSHKVLLVSPGTDISPASSDSTLKERSPSPEKSSRLPQPKGRARSNSPEHSQESSQPPQKIKKTSNLKEPSKLPPTRPRSAEYGVEQCDPGECSTSQPGKSRSIKPPQTGLPKPGFIRSQRSSVSDDKCNNNNNVDDSISVRPSKPSSLPGPKTSTAVKGKGQRMFHPNDTYEIDCQEFDSDFPSVTSPSRVDTQTALTLAYDLDEDNPQTMNRTFACEQEKTFSVMSHSIPNLPTSPGSALGLPTFDEAEMHKAMRDMMSESQISVASSMGILSEQELMDNSLLAEDLYFLLNKKEKPAEDASDASNPPSETEVDFEIAGIITPEIASISSAEQSAKDSSSSPEPEPKDIGKRPDLNLTFDLGAAATSTPVTPVKTDNMAGEKMASPVKSDAITMKLAAASSVLHKEHSRTDLSLDSDEGKHSDHCDSAGSSGTSVLKRDKSSARSSCGSPESFPHKIRTSADLDELEDCASMSASIELTKTAVAQYASLMKAAHEERVVSEIKRRSQEIMIQEQENKDAEADGEDEGDENDDFEDAEDIDDKVNQELILQAGLHLKPRGASSKHSIEVEDIVVDVREGHAKEVSSRCYSAAQSQQTPRVCHEDKADISPTTPEVVTVGEADTMSPKLLRCPEVGVGMCNVMSASNITLEEQSGRGETPGITRVKNMVANPFGSMELTDSMFEIVHQESEMIGATILKTLQQEETLSSPDDVMLGSMTSLLKLDSDYDLLDNEVKVEDENQLIADLLAGHDRNERPTSLVSTCSGDTGIVSDSGLVQGVAAGPNPGELVPGDKERPISIISTTSSVDTGYNGDAYDDEPGTLTANTPHHPDLSPTDHPLVDYTTKYNLPPPHEQVAEAGDGQVRGAVEEPLASLVDVPERIVSGMNDANRTYTEPPAQPLNVSYSVNEPTPALLSRAYTEQDAAGIQPTQALLNQTHDIKDVKDDLLPVGILSDTYTEVDAQVDVKNPAILSETYSEVDSRGEGQAPVILSETYAESDSRGEGQAPVILSETYSEADSRGEGQAPVILSETYSEADSRGEGQAPVILSETYSEADSRGEGQAPVILSQTYTEIDTEAGATSKVVTRETDGEETAPVLLNQTYTDQGAEDKDKASPILSQTYTADEGNDVEIAAAILSETYTEHGNEKDTLASAILAEPSTGENVQAQEISPPVLSQTHTDDCTEVDKIAPAILSETPAEPDTDTPTAVSGCADHIPSEVLLHAVAPLLSPSTVEPGSEPLPSASVQPHVALELSPSQTFTPTLDTISTKPLVLSCHVEDRHTASLGDAVLQKNTAALSEAGDTVLDEAAASAALADVVPLSIISASAATVADAAPPSPPSPPSSISPDTHHTETGVDMDGSFGAEMIVGGAVGVGMVSNEVDVYMRGISPVADNPDLLEGLPMDQPRDLTPSPPYTPMESTPVTVTSLVQAHESHTPMDTSEDDVMAVPAKSPDNLAVVADVMSESTVKDAGKEDVHKDVEMEVNSREGEPEVMAVPEESIESEAKKSDTKTAGPTPSKRLTASSKSGGRTKGADSTAGETPASDNKTNRRLSTSKVLKPASEKAEIKKATSRIGSYLKKPIKVKSKEESENENQVIKNVKNLSGSEKKPLSVVLSPGITNDKEDKVSKMDLDPSEDACTVQAYPVIASGDEPPPGKRPPTGKIPPAKGMSVMGPPQNIPKPRPVGKVPPSKTGSIPKPATQSRLYGAKPSPRSSVGITVPRRTSTAAPPSASANKPTGLRKLSAPVAPTASKLSLPSRLRKSPSPEPSSRGASRMSSMSDASQADLNTSQSSTMSDGLERSTSSSVSSVKKPGNKTTSTLRQTERRSSSDSQLSLCSDVSTDSYMSSQGPQRLTPRSTTKPSPATPSTRRSIAGPAPSQSRIAIAGSRRTSVPAPSSRLAPRSTPSALKPPGRPTATSTPVKKRLPTGDGVGRGARSRPTSTSTAPLSPPTTSTASSTGVTPLKRPHQPDVVTAATQALNEEARAATAEVGRLSCEVARLEGVCEARTRQLGGVRSELVQGSRGMEAMLVLIHYLTHELEAFSCPQLKARLHHVRGDLSIAQRQLEELKKKRDQVLCEVKRTKQESERQLKQADEKYSHEVQSLKLYHEKDTLEKQQEHEESVHALEMKHTEQLQEEQQEHEDILNELQKKHETQLEEITKRFETIRFTLSEKMESMRNECEDLRRREKSIIEGCQRETDYKVQQSLQPYKLLPAEIDSLRAVVELRNQEIHDLRRQKNELLKELEKLPPARDKIKSLQQEKENLQAIVELRGDYEKQLSEKHQVLLRRFERETKANKRLSMDYEELAYRMSTSETGASSPDLMRRSVSHSPTNIDVHPEHHVIMRRKKSPLPPPHSPRSPRSPASFSDFDGTPNGTPCRSPHQNGSSQLSTPPKTNLKRSGTYDLLDQAFDENSTLEDTMHES